MLSRIYWFTELLGRWSMVDIFVVSILVALVQFGSYMTITPGPGALAFAGVVVLTMFAASSFDPRLLWDRLEILKSAAKLPQPPACE
jgi:paraquat-inducible protein A